MLPALIIVGLLALTGAWDFFLYKLSGRPRWDPLWMAFSTTAGALLYIGAGAMGYVLERRGWASQVIWSEVEIGLAMGLASLFFWRKGLQRL